VSDLKKVNSLKPDRTVKSPIWDLVLVLNFTFGVILGAIRFNAMITALSLTGFINADSNRGRTFRANADKLMIPSANPSSRKGDSLTIVFKSSAMVTMLNI
jgi:hypothetical protein